MALVVTLQLLGNPIVNRPTTMQVNVTNTSASSVTINTIEANDLLIRAAAVVGPINFLTPNVALGQGHPTLAAGASASYTFKAVFSTPINVGVSPNTFPSPAGVSVGQPPTSANTVGVIVTASDGSVGSATTTVAPITANTPFPPVATGTLQLQFNNGFDLIGLAVGL